MLKFGDTLVPVGRWFVVWLVMLLGLQLTGLSCLDEWSNWFSQQSMTVYQQATAPADGDNSAIEDGCPCHLAFLSKPSRHSQVSFLVHLVDEGSFRAPILQQPFIPFHPPLVV